MSNMQASVRVPADSRSQLQYMPAVQYNYSKAPYVTDQDIFLI